MNRAIERLWDDLCVTIYGKRRRTYGWPGRLANTCGYLALVVLPFAIGLAMALLVVGIDPLQLRPWGAPTRLSEHNYPPMITPKLVRAVIRNEYEVVLIGGSTGQGVTIAQMRGMFGVKHAFNLAYTSPRVQDSTVIMNQAVETPGLRRLIVDLPFTLLQTHSAPEPPGAAAITIQNRQWYSLPDFETDIVRAALKQAMGGRFSYPIWEGYHRRMEKRGTILRRPRLVKGLEQAYRTTPSSTFAARQVLPCNRYGYIADTLLPATRRAGERGIIVDYYFPPLPVESYPLFEIRPNMRTYDRTHSMFDQLISFRRCLVDALAATGLDNARVHAVDIDPELVLDIAHYRDSFHLSAARHYERVIDDIKHRRFEITAKTFDAYAARLRTMVLDSYRRRGLAVPDRTAPRW